MKCRGFLVSALVAILGISGVRPVSAQSSGAPAVLLQDGATLADVVRVSGQNSKAAVLEARHQGRSFVRKAWCDRDTVYTEFGAYSMVLDRSSAVQNNGSLTLSLAWKEHRTERIFSGPEIGRLEALLWTFKVLCPDRLQEIESSLSEAERAMSHYACRTHNTRFSLVLDPGRRQVSIREFNPSKPIVTLRILREATGDECAKFGYVLAGATFCMMTQGVASLEWVARGLTLDCDSADVR